MEDNRGMGKEEGNVLMRMKDWDLENLMMMQTMENRREEKRRVWHFNNLNEIGRRNERHGEKREFMIE